MKKYDINFSIDLTQSILWQYNNAERLRALIAAEARFFDAEVQGFWQNWYRDVFNLNTANGFGLAVWAVILGVSQDIRLGEDVPADVWGFDTEAIDNGNKNFVHGNFVRTENVLQVKTEQLRMLLKIRAMQLVSNGSAYDINRMLKMIFGDRAYVLDNHDMSITYVLDDSLSLDELFILQETSAFKPPAGVEYKLKFTRDNNWGFGTFRENYSDSNFY